jgi:hypothetical protein
MNGFQAIALISCAGGIALGQTTVSFESMEWKDFGTNTITNLSGNFLPGWSDLGGTPDLGVNVFGRANQSLSGAPNDAALWLNHYDEFAPNAEYTEIAGLSLSGFTIGQTYDLSFYATLLLDISSGWGGNNDALDVAISGADISDWDSTVLSDSVDSDGLNVWVAQSLVFTAQESIVEFQFGAHNEVPGIAAARMGIDGFNIAIVPSPSTAFLLAAGGLLTIRRKR